MRDRPAKQPFEPSRRLQGLLCCPMGGTIDGLHGDHMLLAPPYIIEPEHVNELLEKLAAALQSALINT